MTKPKTVDDLVDIDDLLSREKLSGHDARQERLAEIRAKTTEIRAEMLEIDTKNATRELAGGDKTRWDNLRRGTERLELAQRRLSDAQDVYLRDVGSRPGNLVPDWFSVNKNRSAFDSTNSDGLRARARQAVETSERASDDAKESATRLLERSVRDPHLVDVERHIYETTHPAYVAAFEKYLNDPEGFRADLTPEENEAFRTVNRRGRADRMTPASFGDTEARAAMSLTGANGGVLVPQFLDPSITLTTAGAYNDIRAISDVIAINVDQWDGVTSAGVDAQWLAEGAAASDSSPTFVAPTIPVYKMAAWLYGSYEVLADAEFGELSMLLADAKNRLEATAFTSGTGSGQPTGLLTALSGVGPVITGTSSTYVSGAYSLTTGLGARWQNSARWLTSKATTIKIRQEASALASQTLWADIAGGVPPELLGSPVHLNSVMTGSSGDFPLVHGAFDNYKIIDRIGTQVLYNPMIMSTGSGTPTGQAGWLAFSRVGANCVNSSAFKVLRILGS